MTTTELELAGQEARNAILLQGFKQMRDALAAIKDRIGDLDKLQGDDKAQGRKWALEAVWDIAHNALILPSTKDRR